MKQASEKLCTIKTGSGAREAALSHFRRRVFFARGAILHLGDSFILMDGLTYRNIGLIGAVMGTCKQPVIIDLCCIIIAKTKNNGRKLILI